MGEKLLVEQYNLKLQVQVLQMSEQLVFQWLDLVAPRSQ